MARLAVTVLQDEKGNWSVHNGPDVPYADQKAEFSKLIQKNFRKGDTQYVYGEVISGPARRFRTSRAKEDQKIALSKEMAKRAEESRKAAEAESEDADVSREELEAQATELGIKFTARMKDETLAAKIAEAQEVPE